MSVEAMIWAMQLAPVPMDAGGKGRPPKDGDKKVTPHPSSACAFVLLGLANHAGPDGADAFPSTATLARYTRLSERIVQKCLDRLEADGVIRPSDPAIIAAKIRRADRRPKGWDLAVERVRDDLTSAQLDEIGRQNPFLKPWIDAHRSATRGELDSERGEIHNADPECNSPEPSLEPSTEPSYGSSDHWATQPAHEQPRRRTVKRPPRRLTQAEIDADFAALKALCSQALEDSPMSVWWTLRHEHGAVRPSKFMAKLVDFGEWEGFVGSNGITEYNFDGSPA